jgi:hypothetical protein
MRREEKVFLLLLREEKIFLLLFPSPSKSQQLRLRLETGAVRR